MWSLDAITRVTDLGTRMAKARKQGPIVPTEAQLKSLALGELIGAGMRFPFIGNYLPKGWKLAETFFVDLTGEGSSSEPALTFSKFAVTVSRYPGSGWAMVERGQFQGHIGRFERT